MDEGTVRAVGTQGSGGSGGRGAVGRDAIARVTRIARRARAALRRAALRRAALRRAVLRRLGSRRAEVGPTGAGPAGVGLTGAGPAGVSPTDAGPGDAGPSDAGPAEVKGPGDAAFLAEASAILGSTLDARHLVEFVVSLTVPRLSDGVMVFLTAEAGEAAAALAGDVSERGGPSGLAGDPGQIPLAATVHRDARIAAYLKSATAIRPARLEDDFGPGLVVRTGQTWYLPFVPTWLETLILPSEPGLTRFKDVTYGPLLAVPMPGAGRVLGVILLTRVGRRFSAAEISLVEAFGRRAGMALNNAVAYHSALESAMTLQRSLLPAHPPAIAGGELAMRYLPATAGTQAGGDLYDVILLPDGRVGLAIGDVMGRGLGAAAQMGQLRAALRAFALSGTAPGDLLAGLARVASSLDVSFATCLYGIYDPTSNGLRFASAGHFPPLVLIPGRPVAYAELEPGLCFGVDETITGPITYEETALELPPGSAVLFFTDGLVESRRQPVDDGMEQLRAGLAGERPPPGA
ncbi:MAG: PP2C family protein-serine/threonine phosphatase, partial [Frankia sp.]